jgi:hypothetical protein
MVQPPVLDGGGRGYKLSHAAGAYITDFIWLRCGGVYEALSILQMGNNCDSTFGDGMVHQDLRLPFPHPTTYSRGDGEAEFIEAGQQFGGSADQIHISCLQYFIHCACNPVVRCRHRDDIGCWSNPTAPVCQRISHNSMMIGKWWLSSSWRCWIEQTPNIILNLALLSHFEMIESFLGLPSFWEWWLDPP